MASPAQITANRANAQHSTGPRTPEGKAALAQNNLHHGLASPVHIILPGEDAEAFKTLHGSLLLEHNPQTLSETFCVGQMVVDIRTIGR